MRIARVVGMIGRVMMTAGAVLLLFVVYQLWGTGLQAAQEQERIEDEFAALQESVGAPSATTTTPPDTSTADTSVPDGTTPPTSAPVAQPVSLPVLDPGDPIGRIRIDKIGVDWMVIEGVPLSLLNKAPGHFPGTPLPGQAGNSAIAGHRTTYGAPFNRVDELKSGDEITITYVTGAEFTYSYRTTEIVTPDRTDVLQAKDFDGDGETDNMLTLTACHPKYSARERIIIRARLEEAPIPIPQGQRPTRQEEVSLDDAEQTEPVSKAPAVLWGLAAAAIWLAAYFVGRAWRKWPAYLIGFPFFAVTLYVFFENFYKLLPAGF